jgi:hypothetical protein
VKILKNEWRKNMRNIIIGVKKDDLLRLLNVAFEKEQRRILNNEACHFDLVLHPASSNDPIENFFIDNYLYHTYIEYFTSTSSSDDYVSETCKIDLEIPAVVLPEEKDMERLPILMGLVGISSIEKIIDIINKIESETIEIRINPIETDGMFSYSITSIEDHLFPADTVKIF